VKANATSNESAILDWGDSNTNFFALHQYYSQWIVFSRGPVNGSDALGGTVSTSVFKYVVGTLDGSNTLTLYENGSQVAQFNSSFRPNTFGTMDAELGILPTAFNEPYDGWIDEARVSSIARSADWITTEYNSQNSPGTFVAMGSESCQATPTPTPTSTPTATFTPTPTPISQCTVPNFIGARLNQAQSIWSNAGFTTSVTTVGRMNRRVTSQSLPAGYVGSCTTTTITVTAR
jgi:hypothetical protein